MWALLEARRVGVVSGVRETEQEPASPLTREWGDSFLCIGQVV